MKKIFFYSFLILLGLIILGLGLFLLISGSKKNLELIHEFSSCESESESTVCMGEVISAAKEISKCELLSDNSLKVDCYSNIDILSGVLLKCESESEISRDNCLLTEAVKYNVDYNERDCRKFLKTEQGIQSCESLYKYNKILKSANPEKCETFWGPEDDAESFRTTCLHDMAVETGNGALCDGLEDRGEYYLLKSECLIDVGVANEDSSICEDLVDQYDIKSKCYVEMARGFEDPEICEEINNRVDVYYSDCLNAVAYRTNDWTLCYSPEKWPERKDWCLKSIARKKQDETICEGSSTENAYYGCVMEIVILTKDSSICERVEWKYEENKAGCYKYAG